MWNRISQFVTENKEAITLLGSVIVGGATAVWAVFIHFYSPTEKAPVNPSSPPSVTVQNGSGNISGNNNTFNGNVTIGQPPRSNAIPSSDEPVHGLP